MMSTDNYVVTIDKEVLTRAFLWQLNKEGLINNKTYLATLAYMDKKNKENNKCQ